MLEVDDATASPAHIHSARNPLPRATLIGRALRLRCPCCGRGKMFKNWFKTNRACDACGLIYEREPGYFLGSIYFNYGATAFLVTGLYFAGFFGKWFEPPVLMGITLVVAVLFPLLLFPFTRSLWSAFDLGWDPPDEVQEIGGVGKPVAAAPGSSVND